MKWIKKHDFIPITAWQGPSRPDDIKRRSQGMDKHMTIGWHWTTIYPPWARLWINATGLFFFFFFLFLSLLFRLFVMNQWLGSVMIRDGGIA